MNNTQPFFRLDYGGKLEREIARLLALFEEIKFDSGRYPQRWLAIKLLEGDADILERVQAMFGGHFRRRQGCGTTTNAAANNQDGGILFVQNSVSLAG